MLADLAFLQSQILLPFFFFDYVARECASVVDVLIYIFGEVTSSTFGDFRDVKFLSILTALLSQ